jgi:hypothetical protein
MRRAAAIVLGLLAARAAGATELNLATVEPGQNLVQVRSGAEFAFVASAGYARTLALFDRTLVLHGELTLPWAGVDASDWQVQTGALVPIVGRSGWRLAGDLALLLRTTKNEINRMTGFGLGVGTVGGYYARHWFAAGEAGLDWEYATYIAHTDLYRATVYADAKDGWYRSTGANVHGGLQVGGTYARYDLIVRYGLVRDLGWAPPMLPFYVTLAVNARW